MTSIVIKKRMCESENGSRIGDDECGAQKKNYEYENCEKKFLTSRIEIKKVFIVKRRTIQRRFFRILIYSFVCAL